MTIVTHFKLLGFPLHPYAIVPVFCLALLCYIVTITGNILIISIVWLNRKLQRPMYFFLCNLAIIDICFITTTVPNWLKDILSKEKSLSVFACLAQSYFFFLSGTAEFLILAVMSVDRYLAICFPLQYATVINRVFCIKVTIGVWLGSFSSIFFTSYLIMTLKFCFSEINHFICDVGPLLKNACINTAHIEKCVLVSSSVVIISFLVTFISYINIIIAVAKISSRRKERIISTCSSHAVAVSLVYGSCMFMYSQPKNHNSFRYKYVSIMNTVIVPMLNPFIYTLRNQNVKEIVNTKYLKHLKMQ
uniref:Olfactory receptor n=1 Tax=Pyxicephalus adspersus TaxID=30357 RepID=A0AAV3A5R0_PYXAD|nr:TPA: hypothetical protein GDO54_013903 [Pyxicephalus adspersus]